MSLHRRHTDVLEIGWLDLLSACGRDPFVRVEGHDAARTRECSRLVRFNMAVQLLSETATEVDGVPRVHAERLRRTGERMELLVPSGKYVTLTWDELDWVSWDPGRSPDGRRFKVTTTGQSSFGAFDLEGTPDDGARLVERLTGRVVGRWDDRAAAVAGAVRACTRGAA